MSSSSHASHAAGLIALGVCLGVVVVLGVAAALYFGLRARRQRSEASDATRLSRPPHSRRAANSIVPFSFDGTEPRYAHSHAPGENMRVAYQRPDGSWKFSGAEDEFAPATLCDLDLEAQYRKKEEAKEAEKQKKASVHRTPAALDLPDVAPPSYSQIDASPLRP
ncbi:hypothetical protein BV25DRAFT_1992878 [Artomyces pyxidatus]|uniref:Uncharacterized protein n=1 Tax=Artomyces pyxidatus TaxID=48021 RepID=A0ACB8SVF1_9AGAM|nr:hypothetical protein BV25DRAFT_1992878 [Artomyces pyxidatus]